MIKLKHGAVIRIPEGYTFDTVKHGSRIKFIIVRKMTERETKGSFEDVGEQAKPKMPRYNRANRDRSNANVNYNRVNPAEWKPKHIVQYLKYLYITNLGQLPLSLRWNDHGYTKNAKERSKAWLNGRFIKDKFAALQLNQREIKDYIRWAWDTQSITPTMSLLSCNDWIDKYNIERRKNHELDEDTEMENWSETVHHLQDEK